jgi:F0F1-type ATP synthase delta subunit
MASKRQDLAQVIANHKGSNTQALAKEVAAYLLDTKQTGSLESLVRDVLALREAQGIVEATASTAHDIPEELLKEVQQLLKHQLPKAKTIDVRPAHDSSVIGGLKIRLANEQLDLTVRSKLDTFKRLTAKGTN